MKSIGLTGGIGSGKSTAARILAELGAHVIDADRVGHGVYAPGTEGWTRVVETFGDGVVAGDGAIDRKKLGAIVFSDRSLLDRLNAIVHPMIGNAVRAEMEALALAGSGPAVVIEAALLIEAGWYELVDEVWVVVASRGVVIDRLSRDRAMSRREIEARIDSQIDDAQRLRHADVIVENDGSAEELRDRLSRLWDDRVL